jgi:hypothetical protein
MTKLQYDNILSFNIWDVDISNPARIFMTLILCNSNVIIMTLVTFVDLKNENIGLVILFGFSILLLQKGESSSQTGTDNTVLC